MPCPRANVGMAFFHRAALLPSPSWGIIHAAQFAITSPQKRDRIERRTAFRTDPSPGLADAHPETPPVQHGVRVHAAVRRAVHRRRAILNHSATASRALPAPCPGKLAVCDSGAVLRLAMEPRRPDAGD